MTSQRRKPNSATRPKKEPKLSRTHAPAELSPVDWQRGLRRQFGREQAFGLENLTSEPFFSEFRVTNPASKSSYRVAIRGPGPGEAVTPAEEMTSVASADDAASAAAVSAGTRTDAAGPASARTNGASPRDTGPDPWQAMVQVGAQFVAALTAAGDPKAAAHPWIERDAATGARSLKVPLPPPEIAQQLASSLSALADGLRGRAA
jgi:hypothetical protein